MIGTVEQNLARAAARRILADAEFRRREEADLGVALEFRFRPGDHVDAAADGHIALAPHLVGLDVVVQPVGEYGLTARAELDLAGCLDPLLTDSLEAVGAQKDRVALGRQGNDLRGFERRRLERR